ncbi:MAG: phosphoribosylformylglycinamidine cyclo-ligase [Candidatus Coatesbacteria bacterium]|nr:phosphoribosylformylglycinamidine cyclo-ligase [Candidatus Coatesbacteria bacterium]
MKDYKSAGVDIDEAVSAISLSRKYIESTYNKAVLSRTGAYGGLFSLHDFREKDFILVSSIDGVGTKTEVAKLAGRYEGIGKDIVFHCTNDILVQGAKPLFFLDYFASSKLGKKQLADIIKGASEACREVGCALIGGETAEMPDVYNPGSFDVVGCIIGIVSKKHLLPSRNIRENDVLIGFKSNGLHTNGYSLARKLMLKNKTIDYEWKELGGLSTADALLIPHRCYFRELFEYVEKKKIKALVHITGGGFYDNIPRILPEGIGVEIDIKSWETPPLFKLLKKLGKLTSREAYRIFNMGIGMIAIVSSSDYEKMFKGKDWLKIGKCVIGKGVRL